MRFTTATAILGLLCASSYALTDYDLEQDTGVNCADRVHDCREDDETFLECPLTCAEALDGGLMVQGRTPDEEKFFRLYADSATTGHRFSFERFEDTVTVVAALPLLPGMAQYYYELTELIAIEFPLKVSTVVIPFLETNNRAMDQFNLDVFNNQKSTVLKTHLSSSLGSHPVVGFVESVHRYQKTKDPLYNDRAIIFVVSHDGKFIERRVCPNKTKLTGVIQHYLEYQKAVLESDENEGLNEDLIMVKNV